VALTPEAGLGQSALCVPTERGIGIAKRDRLPMVKDAVAIEWMRTLKAALDPNGILNPGKVL